MSIFRPSNINKRLVGTATTATGGSPGNAGQIGPTKTPYLNKKENILGRRCTGGCCCGVFKINESFCGVKEDCSNFTDTKGFFICCGPSTTKWFVAPACTEASSNWYGRGGAVTNANSCMGSCGWFVPTGTQLQNPGFCCRSFWDSFSSTRYWSNEDYHQSIAVNVSMVDGSLSGNYFNKGCVYPIRAFRCTVS